METTKLSLLRTAMQAYGWRHQAISSNLANLDTPGYQRLGVSFEDTLQGMRHNVQGLRDVNDLHPRVEVGDAPPVLEDEMMDLAENNMRVQFAARALREHFDGLRTGITGRTG